MRIRRSATAVLLAVITVAVWPARGSAATIYFVKSARVPLTGQLWSAEAHGGERRVLRERMPVGPEGAVAALAHNGRRILCLCRNGEIGSVALDGSHLRRLGRLPRNTRYDVVTLGGDGRAFWVKRSNRIWSQAHDGEPKVISWQRNAVVDERVVPNPAGDRVAFVCYGCLGFNCPPGEAMQVRTVRLGGSGMRTVYRSSLENREIADLQWSADGSRLIFSSSTEFEKESTDPFETEYLLVGADGSGPEVLPFSPSDFYSPFFSPSGRRLAVATYSPAGREQLRTVGLDGGSPETVFAGNCRPPSCERPPRVIGWR